jgi:hypothetical protein
MKRKKKQLNDMAYEALDSNEFQGLRSYMGRLYKLYIYKL